MDDGSQLPVGRIITEKSFSKTKALLTMFLAATVTAGMTGCGSRSDCVDQNGDGRCDSTGSGGAGYVGSGGRGSSGSVTGADAGSTGSHGITSGSHGGIGSSGSSAS